MLRGEPSGSARLAEAEDRFNRALAEAVESQADPGSGNERDTEKGLRLLSSRVTVAEDNRTSTALGQARNRVWHGRHDERRRSGTDTGRRSNSWQR